MKEFDCENYIKELQSFESEAGLAPTMSFLVSSALDCSLYRWHLFVYFMEI